MLSGPAAQSSGASAAPDSGAPPAYATRLRAGRWLGKNRLAYKSKMDRDGHLQSGLENGLQESLDRPDVSLDR